MLQGNLSRFLERRSFSSLTSRRRLPVAYSLDCSTHNAVISVRHASWSEKIVTSPYYGGAFLLVEPFEAIGGPDPRAAGLGEAT